MCGEMEDPFMKEEIALLGEDQLLFSSDYPTARREKMPRRIFWNDMM